MHHFNETGTQWTDRGPWAFYLFNVFFVCFLYAGNIEKCPFTYSYWLNGRWFLQIVDIGNFIMRLEIFQFPCPDSDESDGLSSPQLSEQLSPPPRSPATIVFDHQGFSSAPLSLNPVQAERSQDMPAEGSCQRSHRRRRRLLTVSTTCFSEHRSLLLNVLHYRGRMPL